MPENTISKKTLGQYIRGERENYMSLRSFAKELGVSASYLSDVELDRRKVNKAMVGRIAVCFGRVIGGSHRQRYDAMLQASGLITPERRCLKVLWQAMSVVHYDPMIQKMAEYAYDALYEKLDVALYGYPVRKCPPSVADAIPCDEQTGGGE